jgi:hypothetical protein
MHASNSTAGLRLSRLNAPHCEGSEAVPPMTHRVARMPEASLIEPTARSRPMSVCPAMPDMSGAQPAPRHSPDRPIHAARRGLLIQVAAALLCGASGQSSAATSRRALRVTDGTALDDAARGPSHHAPSADDRLVLRAGWVLRACDC